jgi:hypothetical protein
MALTTRRASACRRKPRSVLAVAVGLLVGVAVMVVFPDSHVHALKAAGEFKGTAISGVEPFVEKLKGNVVWLGGTAMGLVIAVVGLMFMASHTRAHEIAFKTLVGLAILTSAGGIVA